MNSSTMKAGSAGVEATHRGMRRFAAIVATAALAFFFAGVIAPQAAQAAPYAQCDTTLNTPGQGVECTIDVVNNLDLATGVTSSTTTYTRCFGAADAVICDAPVIAPSTELVTSISQCNSSVDGGGATLRCHITVTNNIVGGATADIATINQCNGSLGGGEIVLRACSPDPASTSGAAIDQCNNSDNGGTSSLTCIVTAGSTTSSALYVTVSQCNYSANGGGSLVFCTVGMSNNITPAVVVPPVEEETPPTEVTPPTDVTPPTGVTPGPRRTSQVLGSQVVAGGQPQVLASTGFVPASPLRGLMLTSLGVIVLICVQIARRRTALTTSRQR